VARLAVVLFNLGGPDSPDAVRPFLFNLFNDPAIVGAPGPVRWLIARLLSARRAPTAREIYARLGGRSPLLELTERQAAALEATLRDRGEEARTFVAMRYWHPLSGETAAAVKAFAPEEIVLLPLYPQFSTTTTGSSLLDWRRAATAAGIETPTFAACCYPTQAGWIAALAHLTAAGLKEAAAAGKGRPRVLFSAHGLPKKVVAAGDPYQWQVEATAAAVAGRMAVEDLDWRVCYQSRVGPLEWIGPSTEDEIRRAGADGVPVVVVPVAFVSEHSETLVELDVEYRHLAGAAGVPAYVRAPAVGTDPAFIGGLAEVVATARRLRQPVCSAAGGRTCPARFGRCGQA
jgi:ferrochelatase